MLNKSQLVDALVERGAGDRKHVKNMLDHLTAVALEELEAGNDFVVPGLVKLEYTYRKPQKKGERWRKGEEKTGFGGVVETAEADSPPVTKLIKLRAVVTGKAYKLRPGTKPEAQKEFFATKTAKAVVRRKG